MGKTKEEVLNVHIIHSVKGGSGKTAFSLFKVMTLANCKERKLRDKADVLYLDADFKGTAIKSLIYGKNASAFESLNQDRYLSAELGNLELSSTMSPSARLIFDRHYQDMTFNDYLKGHASGMDDILVKGGILGEDLKDKDVIIKEAELEARVDFIFSSPRMEKKKWLQYGGRKQSTPEINLGLCMAKLKKLFNQILDCGYQDLVIDMPPGNDEYSNAVLDVISDYKQEDKVKVYFYTITTNDLTHISAEYEKFADVVRNLEDGPSFDKYVMVFNELRQDEFPDNKINLKREQLKNEMTNNSNCNKVYYTKCSYVHSYYLFCRDEHLVRFSYKLGEEEKKLFD